MAKVASTLVGSLILFLSFAGGAKAADRFPHAPKFRPPDEARVREIAAMLTEHPVPPFPGISDRAYWSTNAYAEACYRRSLGHENDPLPECRDEWRVEFAEAYAKGSSSGSWSEMRYAKAYSKRFERFADFVYAEAYEDKGRFLPKIVEKLESLCRLRTWVAMAHDVKLDAYEGRRAVIDLQVASVSHDVATALVVLDGRLPAETVDLARKSFRQRLVDVYLQDAKALSAGDLQQHWFFGPQNWNPACHGWSLRAAMMLVSDRIERARFIEAAERCIVRYLHNLGPDGYCCEGVGYWRFGFGHFMDLSYEVRRVTNGQVDFFSLKGARQGMEFLAKIPLEKGLYPDFSDGKGKPDPLRMRQGSEIYPDLSDALYGKLPLRSEFPDGQVWVFRRAPDVRPTFSIVMKGGSNAEFHNHNDVGSWQLDSCGVKIAGDPGKESYSPRTFSPHRYESKVLSSYGHPVPRIDGKTQLAGAFARARVIRREFTEARDLVELELADAYRKGMRDEVEQLACLTSLRRTLVYERAKGEIVITDRFASSDPVRFETAITPYDELASCRDGGWMMGRMVKVTVRSDAAYRVNHEKIDNPGDGNITTIHRYGFELEQPAKEGEISVVFKADRPLLARIGIMSDTHVGKTRESCALVECAYRYFREQNVNAIVNCGDIADRFYPEGYENYRQLRYELYPDRSSAPREVFVYAGHDAFDFPESGYQGCESYESAIKRLLDIPNDPWDSFRLGGFQFLVFPQFGANEYGRYEQTIAEACRTNPGRPVFLIEHVPGAWTTHLSNYWGDARRRPILEKYPQVIVIAGHSHGTLYDERNIWQGGYTAVNACCLQNYRLDAVGASNGAQSAATVLVADLYEDSIVFNRRDLVGNCACGEPWVLKFADLPPQGPFAPGRRFADEVVSSFGTKDEVKVSFDANASMMNVSFPSLAGNVRAYRMSVARQDNGGWRTFLVRDVLAEYAKPVQMRKSLMRQSVSTAGFESGERLRLEVVPVGFGTHSGASLAREFVVPEKGAELYAEGVLKERNARSLTYSVRGLEKLNGKVSIVLDLDIDQPEDRAADLRIVGCRSKAYLANRVLTLPGKSSLRYVIDAHLPPNFCDEEVCLEMRGSRPREFSVKKLAFVQSRPKGVK